MILGRYNAITFREILNKTIDILRIQYSEYFREHQCNYTKHLLLFFCLLCNSKNFPEHILYMDLILSVFSAQPLYSGTSIERNSNFLKKNS